MARRISLFEREVTIRIAPIAIELLHESARVLSEGELGDNIYTGSTMMTVDLSRTQDRFSDPPDATTAQRAALLYAADERCRVEARRIAMMEARRVAGYTDLSSPLVDVESRAKGAELHLTLNVEAQARRSA